MPSLTYLALDPGLKSTGVAISHEAKIASPLTTLKTDSLDSFVQAVQKLIDRYSPNVIIVGQPHSGPLNQYAVQLKQRLSLISSSLVILHPEDLSSKQAIAKLIESGSKKTKRAQVQHAAAAALILQDYLDSQKTNP